MSSIETKELKRMCELLGSILPPADHNELTNVDLLKLILKKLSSIDDTTNIHTDDKIRSLASERLHDSLAFPEKVRKNRSSPVRPELWENLKNFNDLLSQDYSSRRQMLLNRLDCTVESFKWKADSKARKSHPPNSEKNNPINDLIHEKYERARVALKDEPDVTLSHLLAVRETESDILLNTVTSSKGTDCKVIYKDRPQGQGDLVYLKRVIIPAVPDRGGRTNEARAPPKETISQQRRSRGRVGRR